MIEIKKGKDKRSIRTRLMVVFSILVSLLVIMQLIFNLFFAKEYYKSYKENLMKECFYEIKESYDGTTGSIEAIVSTYESKENLQVMVTTEEEVIYISYNQRLQEKAPLADYNFPEFENENYSIAPIPGIAKGPMDEMSMLRVLGTFSNESEEIFVTISLPVDSISSSVELFTKSGFIISGIVLIMGCILFSIFSKQLTKPLKEIEEISARYAKLDFRHRANEEAPSRELSSLAQSINSMSGQLEMNIKELNLANEELQKDVDYQKQIENMRREFVANVSHEMKTPLALLQLYAANLQSNVEGIDKEYYCETIIEETERLSDMVSSMLDISSVESGLSKMELKGFDFSELCLNLVIKMKPLLEPFQLQYEIEEGLWIEGDEKYLEQAMKNYVTNAISHTKSGDRISITLHKQEDTCVFTVYNQGKNIADGDLPYVWDSFYRVDKARVRSGKNVGLGLYIVKTIIEKHGGVYQVINQSDGVAFAFEIGKIDEHKKDTEPS
ncbi:MAG: ATP-binding protein [Eubacteriales bacterium]